MNATHALALFSATDLSPSSPEFRDNVRLAASQMARTFAESVATISSQWAAIGDACRDLDTMMRSEESYRSNSFSLDIHYQGHTYYNYDRKPAIDEVIKRMNIQMWELLINRLGIKNLMSIASREKFEKQMKAGDVPPVTEDNIIALVFGLADRAGEFAMESARETLKLLTPSSAHYKTNSGFKIGRRVILPYYVERVWDGKSFRPSYYREAELTAIDATFHVLDEKGLIRERKSPLIQAILDSPDGRGETDYFFFRCYKNRNLHLEFKREDLVKQLNGLATGEYVLGDDGE